MLPWQLPLVHEYGYNQPLVHAFCPLPSLAFGSALEVRRIATYDVANVAVELGWVTRVSGAVALGYGIGHEGGENKGEG